MNSNCVNTRSLLVNEGTGDSIPFSQTEAENGGLTELPTPARSAGLHYSRANAPETVGEVFLEHCIDLRDEQTLNNNDSQAIAAQFAVYRKKAAAKLEEMQKEISTMRESYNQKLRFLQDQFHRKMSDWELKRQQLNEQLDKALKLQISTDHSKTILDIQHYLSQGHHNVLRSPDETEASVHTLADDESVQSTHTVKPNAVLDPITEEQAGSVFSNPHLSSDKQEDPPQITDQDCNEYGRTGSALVGFDTSLTLKPTNLFTFRLLEEEYIKMYRMVTEFKDSIINFFLGREMIPAAQAFQEIAVVRYCPDVDILAQVRLMASSSQCILNEVLTVISALLSTDGMEYSKSSFGWLSHEKATINTGNTLHDKASLKSLQDFGKNANSTISVDCAKGPSQTEFWNQLQLLQQQCDDVIQCNDKGQHQNKQQIDKRKIHISCLQRELDTIHHANTSQHTRRDMKFDKARDPDAILLFTRADANHNTRVLTKGVNNNIISKENYKNAVRTMEQYIDLQKVRFSQLVKQYSQHVTLKEAEKCIKHQVVTTKPISEVFKKMKELYIKKKKGWKDEALKFTEQRITLANTLMNTLENIEEESGLFLIKPTQSWKGRPASKKNKAKVSVHQRMPIKMDPLHQIPAPSFRAAKQMVASSDISSSMPQIVSLTRSYYEKLQDLTPHYNKNPGSVENYIKGLWKMQIDNPESAALCKTILFTTPKLLEMEFKRNGIAERNVSCRLPQLILRDDGRKDLAYNKLQNHFTEKNSSSLHVALQKSIEENEELVMHRLPHIQCPFEADLGPYSRKGTLEAVYDQKTSSFHQ